MRLQTILNSCEKFKSFVYHEIKLDVIDDKKRILVTLVPRKNSRGICSGCAKPGGCYDHLPKREFEFVPLWGIPVTFSYRMRRINCLDCGVKVESIPWADGKETMTKTMMQFLAGWAKKNVLARNREKLQHELAQSVLRSEICCELGVDESSVRQCRIYWG